jgi:thiamine kinase-like enzyme
VQNESRILKHLQGKKLSFLVPHVLLAEDWQGRFVCVQSLPPHQIRPAPKKWNYLYDEALKEMASLGIERKKLSESDFWKQLRDRVCQTGNNYWRHTLEGFMEQILSQLGDRELPFYLAHGDFTPWNTLLTGGQLYLYDWEYALESAPAGYDLYHFAVQRALLVEGRTPGGILSAVKETLHQAQNYRQLIEIDDSAWTTALGVYLVHRLASELDRTKDYGIKTYISLLFVLDAHRTNPTY